ncbi:hypothetical protein FB451DRAFT_1200167 [Mycena latifolia]|nr:hypothetical protein FB451DRAFT_1200167 [Mycena latifolia]
MEETGMEFIGVEWDAHDIILNLKTCYLDIELLPGIFTRDEWIGTARTPDNRRGSKAVLAIGMKTHVLAFLAKDNNSRPFWLSKEDMEASRQERVPGTKWGTIRKDPKKFAAVSTSLRSIIMCQVLNAQKYLSRSFKLNKKRGNSSFLFITTTKDSLRYIRHLTVHGKLKSLTSLRCRKLIGIYNRMSDRTHEEASMTDFFSKNRARTDMDKAPSFFDAGEVADSILLFDGLGPLLFGGDWEAKLAEEGPLAITQEMRDSWRRLPAGLSRLQRLSLKPLNDLSAEELDYLVAQRGDSVNLLIRYFESLEEKSDLGMDSKESSPLSSPRSSLGSDSCSPSPRSLNDVDIEAEDSDDKMYSTTSSITSNKSDSPGNQEIGEVPIFVIGIWELTVLELNDNWIDEDEDGLSTLHLIKDCKRAWMRTYLYRDNKGKQIWALTRAAFNTTFRDEDNQLPTALLFKLESDLVQKTNTIQYIQHHEKGQSIGPMSFCRHARLIRHGSKMKFVTPCLWHPDLTEEQQLLAAREKEAHRNPNKGIRKGTNAQIQKEKNLRASARKTLLDELGREPDEEEVVARVREDRKAKAASSRKGHSKPVAEAAPFKIKSTQLRAKYNTPEDVSLLQTQVSRTLGLYTRKKKEPQPQPKVDLDVMALLLDKFEPDIEMQRVELCSELPTFPGWAGCNGRWGWSRRDGSGHVMHPGDARAKSRDCMQAANERQPEWAEMWLHAEFGAH